jgi:Ca2+-binding RTX toxin-like protein
MAARKLIAVVLLTGAALWMPAGSTAKVSHAGWPPRTGDLIMHKLDQSGVIQGGSSGHNELLGGHGDDTIYAGPNGDVIWGDYKPCCQPTTQVDHLYGGPGNDFLYASHGLDYIYTGGGVDVVHAHFGHGEIHCQSDTVTVFLTRQSRHRYKLFGCHQISYAHTLD